MTSELIDTVAYCGLVCGVCLGGCDCRAAPKPETDHALGYCYQRRCCIEKGLEGCWECESFPCGEGYFAADDEWRGRCIGLVQCIKEEGLERLVRLVSANLGEKVDYLAYRDMSPEQVLSILRGTNG
jgi:hypothetical protein